ncbi:MAG TPA: NAD-dependent epimerase/dehydratase family protein [Terriglobia bacterium]|nr:NAD-dependent epimerase/dehydratase family protein [Terriglobia bacterium]
MRILVLGGDGYLGWPTAMYLSAHDHEVAVLDNFSKRAWELELNAEPLIPVSTLAHRVRAWQEVTSRHIASFVGDLCEYDFVRDVLRDFQPQAIVHFGEQPSAPFSMMDQHRCVMTQVNNISGTLNILWAMREHAPAAHLVKLGTMGEYGTPNIDIEEGFIEIEYKGRKDLLPYPKQAGSFYHLSKVHDSHNITFACKVWKLRSTDLHQGVVYGVATDESELDKRLATSFHYDEVFGTALNRFCVQAIAGIPLTVYGKGGQTRGFLNIRDTLRCVELSILNPPQAGEYRAFNQFTQMFSVLDLAETVQHEAEKLGFVVEINHLPNPRVEAEEHYYNPRHEKLLNLGLEPRLLSDVLVDSMLVTIRDHAHRIRREVIMPHVKWANASEAAVKACASVS